jgi:hypothetical protein
MKKKWWVFLGITIAILAAWIACNPSGGFGFARYAFTVFNRVPRPITDFQVRADGNIRRIAKTHDLNYETVAWLFDEKPELVIVAIGWDGVVEPDERIRASSLVRVLKNKEAVELFNQLKRSGKRVAIHYHSTC